jgi:hypothetical protein
MLEIKDKIVSTLSMKAYWGMRYVVTHSYLRYNMQGELSELGSRRFISGEGALQSIE